MTDPKGNSEFCFPEALKVEVEGKQNSPFPAGPVIKCFVVPPNSKIEKKGRNHLLGAGWLTDFPRFQEARPDHVQVESSSCFPRELVSFDPRHVTHSRPTGRRIWVGRDNNLFVAGSRSCCEVHFFIRVLPFSSLQKRDTSFEIPI